MAAFTTYTSIETPKIELNLPLYDLPLDISDWASSVTPDNKIIVKPKLLIDTPEESEVSTNLSNSNNLSFEELVKQENLPIKITSGFRGYGTKTAQGKLSNHGKKDEQGHSMAYDIVPTNGDFEGLLNLMYSNPRVVNWFKSRGWGILEETTPSVMKQTKATGKHLHIGPDQGALKMFNARLAKAANGMKVPFTTYESTPEITLEFPLIDKPIKISDWSSGVMLDNNLNFGMPIVKNKLFIDTPQENLELSTLEIATPKSVSNNSAVQFFIDKGLSKDHAIGIVANLMQESKLNPEAVNPISKAYGIALWLGDRKKKLFSKYGNKPTLELLLEYVWEELNSTEKKALDRLLQTKSYLEAVHSIMNHYERPSNREKADSISTRLNYAKSLIQ